MTIIYLAEHNCKCYGVTFENNTCVKVQKFKDISNDENNISYIKLLQAFIGKSQVCDMTRMSGLVIMRCLMEILFCSRSEMNADNINLYI